jgi:hypothetical protein
MPRGETETLLARRAARPGRRLSRPRDATPGAGSTIIQSIYRIARKAPSSRPYGGRAGLVDLAFRPRLLWRGRGGVRISFRPRPGQGTAPPSDAGTGPGLVVPVGTCDYVEPQSADTRFASDASQEVHGRRWPAPAAAEAAAAWPLVTNDERMPAAHEVLRMPLVPRLDRVLQAHAAKQLRSG